MVWEVVGLREIRFFAQAVAVLFFVSASSAQAVNIERIRHASGDDYTRIVIDIDGAASYRAAFLPADPGSGVLPRFYVDLSGAGLQRSLLRDLEVGDSRVKRVRTGQFDASTARVVVELSAPVAPKVFTLTSPPRIVIDLENAKGPGPGEPRRLVRGESQPGSRSTAPLNAAVAGQGADTVGTVAPRAPASKPAVVAAVKPAVATRPAVVAPKKPSHGPWTIVIDPGHGGSDPGALGPAGHREKDVTMAISKKLAAKLRSGLGAKVVLTRDRDATLTLAQRKDVANARDADLFISVHANASVRAEAEGIETYYLKNTNDRATLRLAKLENGVDPLIKGNDVSRDADLPFILSDMVQGSKQGESMALARQIQTELVRSVRPRYKGVRDLGVKQGPFYVLDGTYMPSVLVEAGFITHSAEGARIRSSSYQDLVAEGIYRGIRKHLEDESVAGVY